MLKKIFAILLASAALFSVSAAAAPSEWAKSEVEYAIEAKIVPRHLQTDYQTPITREEFCETAMLLWAQLSGKEMPVATSVFTDTANASVAAAASLGIVKGVGEGLFAPHSAVTRQEICVMLKNALVSACPDIALPEKYVNTFPDMDKIADWALVSVQCLNAFSVMLGDENNHINPLGNTTREQAILLCYRLLTTQKLSMQAYIEKFVMVPSGNTHDNMLGGGFFVGMGGGNAYYADASGITSVKGATKSKLTESPAKNMVAFSNTVYYIGADDSIYIKTIDSGIERKLVDTKTDAFSAYFGAIFYRNLHDEGKIYKYILESGETIRVTEKSAELPVIVGDGIFYSTGDGIYRLEKDNTSTLLRNVVNKKLTLRNNIFYYLDGENRLCSIDKDFQNVNVLTETSVNMYCFMRDCIIIQGGDDNAVYKLDYQGRYEIRIDTGMYVKLNTYDDYVYGMDGEGVICSFKNDATEKTRLN